MEYVSYAKCTVISSKHVVFDFKIFRKNPNDIQYGLASEGNIIISEELTYYLDSVKMLNSYYDEETKVDCEMDEILKKSLKKAEWIFEHHVHVI